jgi:phosphoglycolate phosphatase
MMPRLVVFDVDGTLVDSQALIIAAMDEAFAHVGAEPPSAAETLSIVGLSLPEAMRALRPGFDAATLEALVVGYKSSYNALRQGGEGAAPLYPGALATLQALAEMPGLLLGVATGKSRRGLEGLMQAHGLAQYFVTMQVSDDHPSKPHPSMLQRCLADTGASGGVMIGDTEFDMGMGRAAGFGTIGVTWGYHGRERLHQADRVIDRFDELHPALQAIWGQ